MIRLLIIIFVTANCCFADISFRGNRQISSNQLSKLCYQSENILDCLSQLTATYIDNGFFNVAVFIDGAEADTIISIDEGKRYTLADLEIKGIEDSIQVIIFSHFSQSEPLTSGMIEDISNKIVNLYAEAGYPFCKLEISSLQIINDQARLEYLLITGPQTKIGRISYLGVRTTLPKTLDARAKLSVGQLYRESDLARSTQALFRLEYCYPTDQPGVIYNSGTGDVEIQFPMSDRRNIALEGLLYLNPDNSLGGSVDLTLHNLLGGGRKLDLLWSKKDKNSQELVFDLSIPYFNGYPVDLGLHLAQEDRDSSFISTGLNFSAEYRVSDKWKIGAVFGWTKITPEEGRLAPSARLTTIGLISSLDTRQPVIRPVCGFQLHHQFLSSFRNSFNTKDGTVSGYSTHIDAELNHWKSLSSGLVLFTRLYAFQVSSDFDPVPQDQLIQIGGAGSLRGYRESSFLADIGVLTTIELRYYALDNLTLRLFTDNGYIVVSDYEMGLTGFGAGLEVLTTLGNVSLDFSVGEEKSLDNLLVHFGFARGL